METARGKKRQLTFTEAQAARCATLREAQKAYHIGSARWKKLRANRGFVPFRGGGRKTTDQQAELRARIETSVPEKPHLETAVRARELGCSASTCQKALLTLGLIKLDDEWSIRLIGDSRRLFGKRTKGTPDAPLNLDEKGNAKLEGSRGDKPSLPGRRRQYAPTERKQ